MSMQLIHFSDAIVTKVHGDPLKRRGVYKPYGFWVSVEGEINGEESYGWRAWCEAEKFGLGRLAHAHEVTLVPDARVLWIRNGAELEAFDEQWRDQSEPLLSNIDWVGVARQWQGIIIAPYLWSHRLTGPHWYYGWDCASGCIWDVSAIATIREMSVEGDWWLTCPAATRMGRAEAR